ncbi:hypothetical protein P4O66_001271 [Electrophorus voltai]|uniref:Uncharacterized protein n=1 Tax=Electrophorus voltai TaxID=2609070 RepID=A0AAD8ZAL3_9TELE|nr:hypothetical protein P4O66_001271 [Electrophorus voltai]
MSTENGHQSDVEDGFCATNDLCEALMEQPYVCHSGAVSRPASVWDNGGVGNTSSTPHPLDSTITGGVGNTSSTPHPLDSTITGGVGNTSSTPHPLDSTITGGVGNTSSTPHPLDSTITGGVGNTSSTPHPLDSTITGGVGNTSSTPHPLDSTITGGVGNTSSTPHPLDSTITGGVGNTSSTPHPLDSTITGGVGNTSSTPHPLDSTITGGVSNTSSTPHPLDSTITGGVGNTSSTPHPLDSTITGGVGNTSSTPHPLDLPSSTDEHDPEENMRPLKEQRLHLEEQLKSRLEVQLPLRGFLCRRSHHKPKPVRTNRMRSVAAPSLEKGGNNCLTPKSSPGKRPDNPAVTCSLFPNADLLTSGKNQTAAGAREAEVFLAETDNGQLRGNPSPSWTLYPSPDTICISLGTDTHQLHVQHLSHVPYAVTPSSGQPSKRKSNLQQIQQPAAGASKTWNIITTSSRPAIRTLHPRRPTDGALFGGRAARRGDPTRLHPFYSGLESGRTDIGQCPQTGRGFPFVAC